MRVIICGNRHQGSHIPQILRLFELLRERGFSLSVERRFAEYLNDCCGEHIGATEIVDEPRSDVEAAISIGGDGTFLRTARWIGRMGVPVLGINTGHLGFMANYTLEEMESLVEMLLTRSGRREERMVLSIRAEGIPEGIEPFALNEVAILKEDTASMISVNIEVDSLFLAEYLADGLVISTPTGSTGYNLSVGGAILQPTLEAVAIAPIAPHTLTLRPIVLGGESHLRAVTTSRAERYRVSLDGCSFLLPCGTPIIVSKADFKVVTLRRPDDSFPATLRNKLLWGATSTIHNS